MTMNRFADYFVVVGLDVQSGLEPDKLSGKISTFPHPSGMDKHVQIYVSMLIVRIKSHYDSVFEIML